MDVARTIGINATSREVTGTIDEVNVLGALAELAESDPDNEDLFHEAAARVRASRSAGVEAHDPGTGFTRSSLTPASDVATQLRYRSEMAEIFTDLAIDVGLRNHEALVPVS
jgi:hypothetical protein